MTPRRESVLERRAAAWARARGVVVSKLTDPVGIVDHVFWIPGCPLLVEFKRVGGRTDKGREKLQRWYRRKLVGDGYVVGVAKTWAEFTRLRKRAEERGRG
jgi:hypothetical protein